MRILLASDIHGRVQAALALKKAIATLRPERIVYLGDYLYNGPRNGVPEDYDPKIVADILNEFSGKSVGVRGNCDSRVDQMLLRFPMSEDELLLPFGEGKLFCSHGDLPRQSMVDPAPGDAVASGHTHLYALEDHDGVWEINPGSIGFPKGGRPATFCLLEESQAEIRDLATLAVLKTLKRP